MFLKPLSPSSQTHSLPSPLSDTESNHDGAFINQLCTISDQNDTFENLSGDEISGDDSDNDLGASNYVVDKHSSIQMY